MNEPNIDIVGMNAHAMAVQRYDDLCMALLTAIENNESRNDLLDDRPHHPRPNRARHP